MSKNKLFWSIALSLIVTLPIAYAQTPSGFNWFVFIINSVIVFIALFILQSFLIPGKNGKEKTSVWVIILLTSLLIAFFFGRSGFIWQGPLARFFSVYVLVNSIIIAAVLYFVLGFLLKDKVPKSPEGIGGYGILIFLVALIFAVKLGNQWIWDLSTLVQLKDYLFGQTGILNPSPPAYRLWTFIGSATLLAFFFSGYLIKNVPGGNKINYALAIIIASNLARAGISVQSVVMLGEVVFTIVLAEAVKGTAPTIKGFNTSWVISGFLVGWASAAMTYGTDYQGILARIVGYPLWSFGWITVGPTGAPAQPSGFWGWISWIFKMGWGALLIIALPILFFGFVLTRSETIRERRRKYKGIRNAYLRNIIANMHKSIVTKIPYFEKSFMRLVNIPGREPEIIFRNRILFMRLLDQELRFDIFYTKYLYMKHFADLLTNHTQQLRGFIDQVELKKQIVLHRWQRGKIDLGTKIDLRTNTPTGSLLMGEDLDPRYRVAGYERIIGWSYVNKIIIEYMNYLTKYFSENIAHTHSLPTGQDKADFIDRFRQDAVRKGTSEIPTISSAIEASRFEYNKRVEYYPHHYTIKAYTLWMWDMFNASWRGYHPYRFAKKGAKYMDRNGNEAEILDDHTEVNVYGEFADDRRRLDTGQDPQFKADVTAGRIRIRRLKNPKRDSVPFPPGDDMGKIGEYYVRDWTGFIRDFRIGLYHPKSRSVREYEEAWDQGIWKDDNIPWVPRGGSEASPAFDLRILANPGIYTWWGRERYNDPETSVEMKNFEPHTSQFGIKQFILSLIDRTAANVKETKDHLVLYPADTSETATTIEEQKAGKYAVGRFEEKGG